MRVSISVCISHIRSPHYAMYFIEIILDVDGIVPVLQVEKLSLETESDFLLLKGRITNK